MLGFPLIQLARGPSGSVPLLDRGEPYFALDTHTLWIGDGEVNTAFGPGGGDAHADELMADHLAASDPHPQYLTSAEADLTYDPLGAAAAAQAAAIAYADATFSVLGHTHTFASLTSKPTTLAGYGITDAQALNANLTAIAALTTTAFGRGALEWADGAAARSYIGAGTGSGTVTSVNLTPPAAGITVSGGPITTSGSITLALANDLAALEALNTSGFPTRNGTDSWVARVMDASGVGISVANGNGNLGNPTFSLTGDALAVESLTTTGLAARTATDTWTTRTLTGPAAGITVTDGNGVSGNPTLALANDLSALEALSSTGLAARTTTDTWAQRTITVSAPLSITNGNGVSGNPALSLDMGSGQAVITSSFTLSSSAGTWDTVTGLTTGSLAAGTYEIACELEGNINMASGSAAWVSFRLFNSTDSTAITSSERRSAFVGASGIANRQTTPLTATVVLGSSKTIVVQAKRDGSGSPTFTTATVSGVSGDGVSSIRWKRTG